MTTPAITSVTNDGNGTSATLVVDGGVADTITVLARLAGSATDWASKGSRVGPGSVVATPLSNNEVWDFMLTVTGELPSIPARLLITDTTYKYSAIKQALQDWVSDASGWLTIWAPSNRPQPLDDHVAITMRPAQKLGEDYHGAIDSQGIETISGDREFMFEARVNGSAEPDGSNPAMSIAEKIRSALSKQSVRDSLHAAKVATRDEASIQDLTAIDPINFYATALLEVRLATENIETDDVGFIETSDAPTGTYGT